MALVSRKARDPHLDYGLGDLRAELEDQAHDIYYGREAAGDRRFQAIDYSDAMTAVKNLEEALKKCRQELKKINEKERTARAFLRGRIHQIGVIL